MRRTVPAESPLVARWSRKNNMSISLARLGETKRLRLRAPEEKDLGPILALWTDPVATQHIGGPRERSVVLDHFRQYAADPESFVREEAEWWWSIVERSSGEWVGLCSLVEKDVEGQTETDLGYFLLPAYWGRGYATEAAHLVAAFPFSELQLASVVAVIGPRNNASAAVARRLGMGLEREVPRSDGVTRQIYRLRRADWAQASA